MRITIAHTKGRQQMIQIVDRAFDDIFKGVAQVPITIANQQRSWQGSVMAFSLVAKMGFISNPISGTVAVTDTDVTLDADIGMLGKLVPVEKIQTALRTPSFQALRCYPAKPRSDCSLSAPAMGRIMEP